MVNFLIHQTNTDDSTPGMGGPTYEKIFCWVDGSAARSDLPMHCRMSECQVVVSLMPE